MDKNHYIGLLMQIIATESDRTPEARCQTLAINPPSTRMTDPVV
jgi:hypothetical protein